MSALHLFLDEYYDLECGVSVGRLEVGVSADTALRFGTKDHILLSKGDYIYVYDDHYPKGFPAPDYCLDIAPDLQEQYGTDKVLIWKDF